MGAAGRRPASGRPDSFSLGTANTGSEASGSPARTTKDDDVFQKLIKKSADQKPNLGRGNQPAGGPRPMQPQRTRIAFDAGTTARATQRATATKKAPGAAAAAPAKSEEGPLPQGRKLRRIVERSEEAMRKTGVAAKAMAEAAPPSQWYSDDSDAEG